MNTLEIQEALRVKYAAPVYATLFEVRNGTGFKRGPRTADVLIMSTWPSRGLELWGVEIKMSRTDWKKELNDPKKADAIMQYCDRWFLAIGDAKIIQANELPPTWGLMEPAPRGGLHTTREAAKLDAKPMDRLMLAAILRTATDPFKVSEDASRLLAVHRKQWELDAESKRKHDELGRAGRMKELQERIDEFEKASGVKISGWNCGDVGAAVKLVLDADIDGIKNQIARLHNRLGKIISDCGIVAGE